MRCSRLDEDVTHSVSPHSRPPDAIPEMPRRPGGARAIARRWLAQGSGWLALVVVVLAPLPFGSVEPAWVSLWCAAMAVSLLLAGLPALSRTQTGILLAILGVYACLLLAVVLQSFATPPDAIRLRADALLAEASGAASALRHLPSPADLGSSLLFVLVFCRLFLLGTDEAWSRRVFRIVAWSGLGYALYGALAFAFDPSHLLWRAKTAYLGNLTGPFVNRNTAATYFGAITVLWTILLIAAIKRGNAGGLTLSERLWLALSGRDTGLIGLLFGALLCLGATAATGSRAGFLLTLAAVTLTALVYGRIGLGPLRRHPWLTAGGSVLAILVLEMLAGLVATRLHLIGLDDGARLDAYRAGFGLVALRPWLGWGLGNFEAAFAAVRPEAAGLTGVWDRAHSTPLEWAIELGLPFAVLLGALWLWLLGKLLRSGWRTRLPVVIAGGGVGLLGTLHSSIDFSLQIPGFAVTFAALTAIGLAQATSTMTTRSETIGLRGRRRRRSTTPAR